MALLALLAFQAGCVYFLAPLCNESNRFPFDLSGEHTAGPEKQSYKIAKKEKGVGYRLVDYPSVGKSYEFDVCLVVEQLVVEVEATHPGDPEKRVYWPLLAKNEENDEISLYIPAIRTKGAEELEKKKILTIERYPVFLVWNNEKYQVSENTVFSFNAETPAEKLLPAVASTKVRALSFSLPH